MIKSCASLASKLSYVFVAILFLDPKVRQRAMKKGVVVADLDQLYRQNHHHSNSHSKNNISSSCSQLSGTKHNFFFSRMFSALIVNNYCVATLSLLLLLSVSVL